MVLAVRGLAGDGSKDLRCRLSKGTFPFLHDHNNVFLQPCLCAFLSGKGKRRPRWIDFALARRCPHWSGRDARVGSRRFSSNAIKLFKARCGTCSFLETHPSCCTAIETDPDHPRLQLAQIAWLSRI